MTYRTVTDSQTEAKETLHSINSAVFTQKSGTTDCLYLEKTSFTFIAEGDGKFPAQSQSISSPLMS